MSLLSDTIAAIEPMDEGAGDAAARRLDSLTKPLGSLGYLEQVVRRYAAIRHDPEARSGPASILVFVADHGVADEGVSAYPKEVTAQMLRNIARGGAAISVLARHYGYSLKVIDAGVATDTRAEDLPGVIYRRIGPGTRNFMREPAMTAAQAAAALEAGIETVNEAMVDGGTLVGIGEMGIANSTSAAALLSAITGADPATIAGRGTGLDEDGLRRKVEVIRASHERHRASLSDGQRLLAALGGFEIAAMAGVCLGAAARRVPVIVDGFIATAAAAVADRIFPGLAARMFFSHRSAEGGHAIALEHLRARPLLDLDLRLGEGTGAAMAISIIQAALAMFHDMATFAGAAVAEKI
ncbi:MAG TPA: nicotinate-nucleotide--dimethylbenzimidazole phosphoribosyltransferase [Candidatus Binataceae bacterium]